MPVQRRLFGRNVPAIHPRKLAALLGTIALFAVITLVFTLPNSIPSGPSLSKFADHKISLPKLPKVPSPSILNPFRQAAHPPQIQKNSTSGESSWHSAWNWLSPFSSSITLDENRSLLPPLKERFPIYTYYDHTLKKDKALKDAENELLITWRRAWWAQGFKPIILGPAESVSNPLYKELQLMNLEPALKEELMRWLAWEQMGTGLLCQFILLPMEAHEDPLLAFLRRGEYPLLTRFDKLGGGLFAGSKTEITAAVNHALDNKDLKQAKDFISAVKPETFKIEPKHESLAYYDPVTVKDKYSKIADRLVDKDLKFIGATGLLTLNSLMQSHLHSTWQNTFSKGIAVVKPNSLHMTHLIAPALDLAHTLTQCPDSPLPASCPPNRSRCKPCVATSPLKISTPEHYRNTSKLYTIGTVPHPYTMAVLTSFRSDLNVSWIRRESKRDPWLARLTQELLGTGMSGAPRVVRFKDAVASEYGISHSLWLSAEEDLPADLSWIFGFNLPHNSTTLSTGKSETPVPGPERRPKPVHDPKDGEPIPEVEDLEREKYLLEEAIEFRKKSLTKKGVEEKKLRAAMEAWNLADTEAWRFVRAFEARRGLERKGWDDEEKNYAGGAGAERRKKGGIGRWFDE